MQEQILRTAIAGGIHHQEEAQNLTKQKNWWILCGGLEIGPAGFVPKTVLVQERSRNSAGESVAVGAAGGEAGHYAAGTRGIKVSHFAVWHFFERLYRPSLRIQGTNGFLKH